MTMVCKQGKKVLIKKSDRYSIHSTWSNPLLVVISYISFTAVQYCCCIRNVWSVLTSLNSFIYSTLYSEKKWHLDGCKQIQKYWIWPQILEFLSLSPIKVSGIGFFLVWRKKRNAYISLLIFYISGQQHFYLLILRSLSEWCHLNGHATNLCVTFRTLHPTQIFSHPLLLLLPLKGK